jgi:lipoprotein-anchoring transpeptidase ErfK/SrfK
MSISHQSAPAGGVINQFAAGTVIIDTDQTYLYYVLGGNKAIRYGIGVVMAHVVWSAVRNVGEWLIGFATRR